MKTLRSLRAVCLYSIVTVVLLGVVCFVQALTVWQEYRKKKELGINYEGPLED